MTPSQKIHIAIPITIPNVFSIMEKAYSPCQGLGNRTQVWPRAGCRGGPEPGEGPWHPKPRKGPETRRSPFLKRIFLREGFLGERSLSSWLSLGYRMCQAPIPGPERRNRPGGRLAGHKGEKGPQCHRERIT